MTYAPAKGTTLKPNNGHQSDISKLILAEIQTIYSRDHAQLVNAFLGTDHIIDKSLLNIYIKIFMNLSNYLALERQQQYVFLEADSIVFIAFPVS